MAPGRRGLAIGESVSLAEKPTMPVGIVLERHEAEGAWIDYTWHAVSVIEGAVEMMRWGVWAWRGRAAEKSRRAAARHQLQ